MCAVADDERRQAEYTLERMLGEIDRIKAAERRRREMEERLLHQMNESEGRLREAKAEEVPCLVYASCGAAEHLLWLCHDGSPQWVPVDKAKSQRCHMLCATRMFDMS